MSVQLNAIEGALSQTDAIAETAMHAAWWTAVGTILLAVLALLAWRAAMGQLRETEQAASKQVADQTWGRQIDALAKYLTLLHDLHASHPLDHSLFLVDKMGLLHG